MKIFLTLLFLTSFLVFARDEFKHINGKNYYELLDALPTATPEALKKAHRKMILKYHHELSKENLAISQEINAAYDILKDPEKRARYDAWLNGGTSVLQDQDTATDTKFDEAAYREQCLQTLFNEAMKQVEKDLDERPNATIEELAENMRTIIVYHIRFFPAANMTNYDLYKMIETAVISLSTYNKYAYFQRSLVGLVAFAGGAIKYLKERTLYGGSHGNEAKEYLQQIRESLDHILQSEQPRNRLILARETWKLLTGQTYSPTQRPLSNNSCTQHLSYTENGVTYEIPVTITIKLGN